MFPICRRLCPQDLQCDDRFMIRTENFFTLWLTINIGRSIRRIVTQGASGKPEVVPSLRVPTATNTVTGIATVRVYLIKMYPKGTQRYPRFG